MNTHKALLIPVAYKNRPYPAPVAAIVSEVPASFMRSSLEGFGLPMALHTDHAYGHKADLFDPANLERYPELMGCFKRCGGFQVPRLWQSRKWAEEFARYVLDLTATVTEEVHSVEVHPPFNDVCQDMETFLDRYAVFETAIRAHLPKVLLFVENRRRKSTAYTGGGFIFSRPEHYAEISSIIQRKDLVLRLVADFPQLMSELYGPRIPAPQELRRDLEPLRQCREFIDAMHIWGKRSCSGRAAHHGNLDDLFDGQPESKQAFLEFTLDLFGDERPRHFVPEVNSAIEDQDSIITDFLAAGFRFLGPDGEPFPWQVESLEPSAGVRVVQTALPPGDGQSGSGNRSNTVAAWNWFERKARSLNQKMRYQPLLLLSLTDQAGQKDMEEVVDGPAWAAVRNNFRQYCVGYYGSPPPPPALGCALKALWNKGMIAPAESSLLRAIVLDPCLREVLADSELRSRARELLISLHLSGAGGQRVASMGRAS